MKKLEDIPKKEVFDVPEGYFEKLPGMIQSRVSNPGAFSRPAWVYGLRYALPAVILLAVTIFWFNRPTGDGSPEGLLASVQTEELVAYLNDTDLTTDELLEQVHLDGTDASEIENDVYGLNISADDLDTILDDID
jgi:hypothetical protein